MKDAIKRSIDVIVSASGLVLLSPVLVATAVAVRLAIGRPVLFRHVRPGWRGRPFTIYKFRTMLDDRDADGTLRPDAVRLTKLGRVLRSSSLDELLELWNVLRGEMSLVGPRPLLMEYLPLYTAEQARRHSIRPGMTGWAQVMGRNRLSWEKKLEADIWYIEHRSTLVDFYILFLTVGCVLARDGITQAGHATSERFRGVIR